LNVVDAFPDGRPAKALGKTLETVFAKVQVWLETIPDTPQRVSHGLSAADRRGPGSVLGSSRGVPRRWYGTSEPLLASGTPLADLADLLVLRDDHAPVERLMADPFLSPRGR
jgi:hypothetical protein